MPPVGYLQKLREICTKHGILLIFDEVITGFGRIGDPSASQQPSASRPISSRSRRASTTARCRWAA
jgi:adenosylmethionine-8-amino-7-oxononanoate aminotransferase